MHVNVILLTLRVNFSSQKLTELSCSFSDVISVSGCNDSYLNSISEPEPGRCRRTDGKKWRCKSAVLPGQKYCAHMHRDAKRRFTNLKCPPSIPESEPFVDCNEKSYIFVDCWSINVCVHEEYMNQIF